jgi:signal transduction histidine kinase
MQEHIESDVAKDLLRRTINDSAYLMALTDNLHLASRLSDGVDPTEGHARTDLGELVDKMELRFSLLGKMSGVQVVAARPDKPVWVICDPFIAERALSNIVHNAVTHGEDGGNVAVVLEVIDGTFELVVSDDGPGVPPEELTMLSERTFRSDDARQRDVAGQGLGLAITHEIAKRLGWTLEFSCVDPRGLQVRLKGSHVG